MISQYEFELSMKEDYPIKLEWGYRFYAYLLGISSGALGERVHQTGITPISQHLNLKNDKILWNVTLFGNYVEESLCNTLDELEQIELANNQCFIVRSKRRKKIDTVQEMFLCSSTRNKKHRLDFVTPTCFKSHGAYANFPSSRRIIQNLISKWNGCFEDCRIEDEDGEGIDAIAGGLSCQRFKLNDKYYHLKENPIPGFVGTMIFENHLQGFHKELADMLLHFSGYAGIGIKTTLGMGGVNHKLLK